MANWDTQFLYLIHKVNGLKFMYCVFWLMHSGHFIIPLSIFGNLVAFCNFPSFQVSILWLKSVFLEVFAIRKYVGGLKWWWCSRYYIGIEVFNFVCTWCYCCCCQTCHCVLFLLIEAGRNILRLHGQVWGVWLSHLLQRDHWSITEIT